MIRGLRQVLLALPTHLHLHRHVRSLWVWPARDTGAQLCHQQASYAPLSFSYFPRFLSPSAKHSYLRMRNVFLPQPSWGIQDVSSLEHVCVSTLLMARDCPSHSRGFPLPEACIRNGRRVSEATHPHTGDSTAGAQSQAGGSGQAGSAGGNNSHGHSEGDTGVSLGSKEPLLPTRTPSPICGILRSF